MSRQLSPAEDAALGAVMPEVVKAIASAVSTGHWYPKPIALAVLGIEAKARDAALAAVRERVEGLIATAGGRCVGPDDYGPDEINICEAHSEVLWDDGCEDQPRQLLAVVAILDEIGA